MTHHRRYVQPSPEMGGVTKFILFCAFLSGIGFGIGNRLDERHIAAIIQYLGIALIVAAAVWALGYGITKAREQALPMEYYPRPRPRSQPSLYGQRQQQQPLLPYDVHGAFSEASEQTAEEGTWVEIPSHSTQPKSAGTEWS